MARGRQSLIFLDTHVVVWLYAGLTEKITEKAKKKIDDCNTIISQIVRLELQYLYEIGRIKVKPAKIVSSLSKSIDLKISDCPINELIDEALKIGWTRDVFDRLLTAEAKVKGIGLITADRNIQKHFMQAIW